MNIEEAPAVAETPAPTIRELVAGYEAFNAWEMDQQPRELQRLTFEEGLAQYFELSGLAQVQASGARADFLAQDERHWLDLHRKLQKCHAATTHGQTAPGTG
jgi:hypothetical protein